MSLLDKTYTFFVHRPKTACPYIDTKAMRFGRLGKNFDRQYLATINEIPTNKQTHRYL